MSAWLLLASRPVAQVRSSADTFVAPMLKLKSHKVLQTYQHFIQAKKKINHWRSKWRHIIQSQHTSQTLRLRSVETQWSLHCGLRTTSLHNPLPRQTCSVILTLGGFAPPQIYFNFILQSAAAAAAGIASGRLAAEAAPPELADRGWGARLLETGRREKRGAEVEEEEE